MVASSKCAGYVGMSARSRRSPLSAAATPARYALRISAIERMRSATTGCSASSVRNWVGLAVAIRLGAITLNDALSVEVCSSRSGIEPKWEPSSNTTWGAPSIVTPIWPLRMATNSLATPPCDPSDLPGSTSVTVNFSAARLSWVRPSPANNSCPAVHGNSRRASSPAHHRGRPATTRPARSTLMRNDEIGFEHLGGGT